MPEPDMAGHYKKLKLINRQFYCWCAQEQLKLIRKIVRDNNVGLMDELFRPELYPGAYRYVLPHVMGMRDPITKRLADSAVQFVKSVYEYRPSTHRTLVSLGRIAREALSLAQLKWNYKHQLKLYVRSVALVWVPITLAMTALISLSPSHARFIPKRPHNAHDGAFRVLHLLGILSLCECLDWLYYGDCLGPAV